MTRERNYIYCGDKLVHSAAYEQSPSEKYPDISVLQQPWTEKVLLDAVLAHPNVELRWLSPVTQVLGADTEQPTVCVNTPEGSYELKVDYVVAADGARGQVRRSLGNHLRMCMSAPIPDFGRDFEKRFGLRFIQSYSLTDFGPSHAFSLVDSVTKLGSCGRARVGIQSLVVLSAIAPSSGR